jgi:purine-nucleoside phosphorylase
MERGRPAESLVASDARHVPSRERELAAFTAIRARLDVPPTVALITGSGLGGIAAGVAVRERLAYAEIPGWPVGSVPGHPGELILGELGGMPVAAACGRVHLYEGFAPTDLGFAVRVLRRLGARLLIASNAAGSLTRRLRPGHVMLLRDHIYLPGLAGASPMAGAYDARLRSAFKAYAARAGLASHEGVYAVVAGPSFETPAEAAMLRRWGADAVGMSTVPEVVTARHLGMRVLAFSVITNRAGTAPDAGDVHADVLGTCMRLAPTLAAVLERLAASGELG